MGPRRRDHRRPAAGSGPQADRHRPAGTGVVLAQADLDQLIARTDDGAVVLSGRRAASRSTPSTARCDPRPDLGDRSVLAPPPKRRHHRRLPRRRAAHRRGQKSDGDVVIALPERGPYLVNANTGEDRRHIVRVPQTQPATAAASSPRVGHRRRNHRRPALSQFRGKIAFRAC